MSHHGTRFYVVQSSDDNPDDRWILAEFGTKIDAEQFVGEVCGTVHTINDDGIPELLERWRAGDDSVPARVLAREAIATTMQNLRSVEASFRHDDELTERYAESDPACAALIRLRQLMGEASYIIGQIIPEGVEKFEGIAVK